MVLFKVKLDGNNLPPMSVAKALGGEKLGIQCHANNEEQSYRGNFLAHGLMQRLAVQLQAYSVTEGDKWTWNMKKAKEDYKLGKDFEASKVCNAVVGKKLKE